MTAITYVDAFVTGLDARGYVFTVTPTGGGCMSVAGVVGGIEWHITDGDAGLPDGSVFDGATAVLSGYDADGGPVSDCAHAFGVSDAYALADAVADVLDDRNGEGVNR